MIRSLLEILGVMVFAASGVLSAGRKDVDLYQVLQRFAIDDQAAALIGMALIATLRLGAIMHDWRLPIPRVQAGPSDGAPPA